MPLSIPDGKYIKAAEYRPGNRRVVHHAALAIDVGGKARQLDAADPAPGFKGGLAIPGRLFPGSLAAWTPGRDPLPLPDGLSLPWKSGTDLILQLHLHPVGKVETEQSTIGLYLTDEPPRRSMIDLVLIDKKIDIPPGDRAYRTRDEFTLPLDMDALGLFPHMHLIGRDLKVTAHPPQGEPFSLLWINDWDFNWQNFYQFAAPVRLAAGTRITLECVHDNSAENVRNPSQPPRRVTWGEETTNEMSAAILQLIPVREADLAKMAPHRGRILGAITVSTPDASRDFAREARIGLEKADRDQDGKLNLDELAAVTGKDRKLMAEQLARFDADKDGSLNLSEIATALKALPTVKPGE